MFLWQTASNLAGVRAEYRCSWDSKRPPQRRGTGEQHAAGGRGGCSAGRGRRRQLWIPREGSAGGLWSSRTTSCSQPRAPLQLLRRGRVPSVLGSAPRGFTFLQNKAHVRGLNPVFKHIFLSVTLKMSPRAPRKPEWDLSCSSALWAGYCLPSEIPFYPSCFGQL